ncbi:hypothetical protein FB446DRAFT_725056 [Lentinula raphanica]|nr:hypothetical protein FB446DRAFT_725056 [Lentinula raphanica]
MVASKSKKVTKATRTYRERAISAVIASPRKGGAHLTTIKAQVRKDADKKKEKLGPQWATWVTKAVHQLTESGLLLKKDTHYELSPATKRTLKESERTWPVAGPYGEEILVKHLLKATPSTKRRAESQIDSTPTKKSRGANASTQADRGSPWLKKKKVELVAEIERLQRERLQPLRLTSRSPSPLTDLDDDEDPGVPDTDGFFSSQGHPDMHPDNLDLPTRPSTPVDLDQSSFLPSTPIRPHGSLMHNRPLLQVRRTQSGTYLANGRPTPEPPEFMDQEHNCSSMDMGVDPGNPSINRNTGLATPGQTPARSSSSHESIASSQMMAFELARISEENKQLRIDEAAQIASINSLDAELQSLRKTNAESGERATALETEIFTLRAALLHSTEHCSSLDMQLSAGSTEIVSLRKSLDMKNAEIANILQQLQDANGTLEARTQDLEVSHSAASKLTKDLISIKAQMDAREVELQSKIEAAERSVAVSSANLQQRVAELDSIRQDLKAAHEAINGYQDRLEELRRTHIAELDEHNTTIGFLRASLSSSGSELARLRSELDQTTETCAQLRADLEQSILDKTQLNEELATERIYSASVKGELDRALSSLSQVKQEYEEMETLRTDDAATITKLRNTIQRIHAIQMEQWAGITEEVASASPAPRRPRFSI